MDGKRIYQENLWMILFKYVKWNIQSAECLSWGVRAFKPPAWPKIHFITLHNPHTQSTTPQMHPFVSVLLTKIRPFIHNTPLLLLSGCPTSPPLAKIRLTWTYAANTETSCCLSTSSIFQILAFQCLADPTNHLSSVEPPVDPPQQDLQTIFGECWS